MISNRNVLGHAQEETVDTLGFTKGQVIYRQGDPALFWFEVVSGMVRTSHLFLDGRRQLTGFFCPEEIFGADQGNYNSSAEAVTTIAWVRRVRWGTTAEDDHSLERALTSAENSILLLGHRTAAARIAAFLLDLRTRTSSGRLVPLPMPRCDIADYLGLTVETVSRTFTMLTRRKLINQNEPHHVRIDHLEGLYAVASGQDQDTPQKQALH